MHSLYFKTSAASMLLRIRMADHGTFYWNELVTVDQKRAGEFYSSLLGWKCREIDAGRFGIYTLFTLDDKDVAGMMNPISEYARARSPWWSAYVAVDNIDACAKKVAGLGGRLVEGVTEIPGVGRTCMVADPMGAMICLMTPIEASSRRSSISIPDHGTFMWNHLVTADQRKCGEFYSSLLGWHRHVLDALPFGVYTIFEQNGNDVAGMMNSTIDFTRSRPPQWYAYIAVDDVEACATRAEQLGGKLIERPHEVPGVGRACLIADPTGAPITFMSRSR
jgi:uncharacterized protein